MPRGFSPEELEELRRFDEEIDRTFEITYEEIEASRKLDMEALEDRILPEQQSIRESKARYRERNKAKLASYYASYYRANKDSVYAAKKKYRAKDRESYNAYIKEWKRKNKEEKQ